MSEVEKIQEAEAGCENSLKGTTQGQVAFNQSKQKCIDRGTT
jgi:hypothetical protein